MIPRGGIPDPACAVAEKSGGRECAVGLAFCEVFFAPSGENFDRDLNSPITPKSADAAANP